MKIIAGKYPEEKNIDAWLTAPNLNCNIVLLWRLAAYVRDTVGSKCDGFARRTTAEQQALYDAWLAKKGNEAAAPGTSWHEFGQAFDFNRRSTGADGIGIYPGTINADFDLWKQGKPETLNKYGLCHAVSTERWHIQAVETIGYAGTRANFADPDDYYRDDYTESDGLKRGDKNANVGTWQTILNSKGYGLDVDNDFGPATETATNAHKESIGMAKDGIVDFDTLLVSYSASVKDSQSKLDQARYNALKLNDRIDSLTNENGMLEGDIRELDQRIATLVKKNAEQETKISEQAAMITEQSTVISEQTATISEQAAKIESDKFKIDTIDEAERTHKEIVANLNEQIAELLIK